MSTDFNINLAQLHEKNLIEVLEPYTDEHHYQDEFGEAKVEPYEGTRVKFVGYEYFRECYEEGNTLCVSCSGSFRVWLRYYLRLNDIEFIALIKPSINWDHVHPDYKWLATDANGKSFLYTMEPYRSTYHKTWLHSDTTSRNTKANAYSSFEKGTYDWKDSLVERP